MAGGSQIRQRGGKGKSRSKSQQVQNDEPPTSTAADPAAAARKAIMSKKRQRKKASPTNGLDARRKRNLQIGAAVSIVVVASIGVAWNWRGQARQASVSDEGGSYYEANPPPQLVNDTKWNRTDPRLHATHRFLTDFVCTTAPGGFCHPNLESVPTRRTHRAKAPVKPGDVVLVLPRSHQIWDLDALRDSFVRAELLGATHGGTGNWLDGGAYLAAYLVRRRKLSTRGEWRGNDGDDDGDTEPEEDGDPLLPYLDVLPTYDDLKYSHPTLWSQSDVTDLLGRFSPASMLVTAYRDMMESEYRALAVVSDEFRTNVGREEYLAARINVMSRSFGTGPPGPEEGRVSAEGVDTLSLDDELEYYERVAGIDLSVGCRAMSPILDAWDSHPHPNSEWRYDPSKRAFVVWATERGIPPGHDVIVSYGKYTEAHLFAKFGYTNGDGSSYTEAYINSNHRLLDQGLMQQFSYLPSDGVGKFDAGRNPLEAQKNELARYLQFDDGYEECIKPDEESEAWTLKELKFRHLQAIANIRDRWVMRVAPRDPKSGPGISSAVPITTEAPIFDPKNMRFNANNLVATCRLIALTHSDFDGEAVQVLTDVLANSTADTFLVERQGEALEYRTVSCIIRLVDMMLWRYPSRVRKDMRLLSSPPAGMDDDEEEESRPAFRSREWLAAQVRLGEMQSLEVLGGTMKGAGRQLRERAERDASTDSTSLVARRKPCVLEDTLALLDLKTRMMGENYVKSTRTFEKRVD